jgi:hypothetical protein
MELWNLIPSIPHLPRTQAKFKYRKKNMQVKIDKRFKSKK